MFWCNAGYMCAGRLKGQLRFCCAVMGQARFWCVEPDEFEKTGTKAASVTMKSEASQVYQCARKAQSNDDFALKVGDTQ